MTAAQIAERLVPHKRAGIPWSAAAQAVGLNNQGNPFVYEIMRAAYTNDDSVIKWNVIRNLTLIRDNLGEPSTADWGSLSRRTVLR